MALSESGGERLNNLVGDGVRQEIVSRLNGTFSTTDTITCGAINASGSIAATGLVRSVTHQCGGGQVKVGASAGWTVGAANNLGTIATMAASQTGGTLVIRVQGLQVGATITGFGVYSSINSAGGTVTLDANLRKITVAAGANGTDASVSSITQVSVTAATASAATKTGISEVVVAGVDYYILLTATTAASTTIELTGIEVTFTTV